MRPSVNPKAKAKARGVSLPPDIERGALKRASTLDVSFSKYVQRLIRADLERGLLVKEGR